MTSPDSTQAPGSLPLRDRLLVAGQLGLCNVLLLALLCGEYEIGSVPHGWQAWFFVHGGRLACAACLSLGPGLLLLGAATLLRRRLALALLSGALWTATLLAVFVDTRIYELFRYHFNGLVWNVMTTPGSDEAVHLSPVEIAWVVGACAVVWTVQTVLALVLWGQAARRREAGRRTPRLLRPSLLWGFLLLPNLFLVTAVYAHADLVRDPQVMAFARVYPLYPRLTIKRFAAHYLGMEMKARPEVRIPREGILLDYPKAAPVIPADGPRPNIVVVVIDSLRADMLAPEVMPRLSALAASGRSFQNHLSSGNSTRFGLFGLVYGLHGSYWGPITDEHRSPVLVDALLERGYETRILTSASMDFPEFRSTAWVRVEPTVEDRLKSDRPGARDDGVAARFESWLDERQEPGRPFFAFLLLDAPHQSYDFPPEETRFRPSADRITYSTIAEDGTRESVEPVYNRYRNAVAYADGVTGRILDALAGRGLLDGSVVVVTGDHGEEFFEHGFFGHTSNFTSTQLHVPLVLHGPGVPPGEETRPTCHVDVPVTLLELLGADPSTAPQWSLGRSLFDPLDERERVASGWERLGLQTPAGEILEIPLATHGGAGVSVWTADWRPVVDDDAVLQREASSLVELALECRRFLR